MLSNSPKEGGTERQKDDFSYHLSDALLNRRLWRFGVAHRIIMHIAANIAKLPELSRSTLLWPRAVIPGVSAICQSVRLLGVRSSL
jgi:hypothetical protein